MTIVRVGSSRIDKGAVLCVLNRQHAMEDEPVPSKRRTEFGIKVEWHCVRCGTIRIDVYNRFSLKKETRSYDHSQAYLAARELFVEWTSEDIRRLLFTPKNQQQAAS